jgi:hypothetical protein
VLGSNPARYGIIARVVDVKNIYINKIIHLYMSTNGFG